MGIISRLARRYDEAVLNQFVYLPKLDSDLLQDKTALDSWLCDLRDRINTDVGISESYEVSIAPATDNQTESICISKRIHGIANDRFIPLEFFGGADYRKLRQLGDQLEGLLEPGAFVQRGEKRQEVYRFSDALNWLMTEARRGQHIQRYKGLGEMNPEQLWETTMDPDVRRLLQVTIEDAVGADEIFTTLMGDQVEPRRDFIERNAFSVSNLDV